MTTTQDISIEAEKMRKQARRYRLLKNLYIILSAISFLCIYASIFLFFENFTKLITGILVSIITTFVFLILSLRALDKALKTDTTFAL